MVSTLATLEADMARRSIAAWRDADRTDSARIISSLTVIRRIFAWRRGQVLTIQFRR
jgi:hypothetical protein